MWPADRGGRGSRRRARSKVERFHRLAVRVFSVGQESGKLDEMLFRLAEDYDAQVATASARFTSLLEPVLILVLAAMVGFLVVGDDPTDFGGRKCYVGRSVLAHEQVTSPAGKGRLATPGEVSVSLPGAGCDRID